MSLFINERRFAMGQPLANFRKMNIETRMFLGNNGITTGRELVKLTPAQIQAMPGFKMEYFENIEQALNSESLYLGFEPRLSLTAPLSELEMGDRETNIFKTIGVHTVGQLIRMEREEIEALPRISKNTVREIVVELAFYGLKLGTRDPEGESFDAHLHQALDALAAAASSAQNSEVHHARLMKAHAKMREAQELQEKARILLREAEELMRSPAA